MVFPNRPVPFELDDLHLAGVSAEQLAAECSMPLFRVKKRLETIRLWLKQQVTLSLGAEQKASER